jgi:hypothetical protein
MADDIPVVARRETARERWRRAQGLATPAGRLSRRPKKERQFIDIARERFEMSARADQQQRERELDDLRFYSGDQWDMAQQNARKAQQASNGLPPVPARPTLTINKIKEPIRQVLNEERMADLGIELVPADDFGELGIEPDHTEIELREGIIRRIQRAPEASEARGWAFSRAAIAGRGYYAIITRYLPGKTWDQEIAIRKIYNQASVSLDPAHEMGDGSDSMWGFIGNDLPWDEYQAQFPWIIDKDGGTRKNDLVDASDDEFRAFGEDVPNWFVDDGKQKTARVVEYFYVELESRTLALLKDGTTAWEDELDARERKQVLDRRTVTERKVKWAKIDGYQVLEETDWPSPDIPIIKVLGEELHPYDHERRAEGMVRASRDSQIGFNAMVSKWVEQVGLAPIPPFQATPEQIEGFETWYQLAATRTLPYLPYNLQSEAGQLLPPPSRTPVDTPISAIAASVQMFNEAIQSTTGVPEARVGRNDDAHLKSGKALQIMRESSQFGTSNYLDNLKRSMRYEGQIINNLLFPIYGAKKGRLARLMDSSGNVSTVVINPGTGPQAPGAPQPTSMPPGGVPSGAPAVPAPRPKPYELTPGGHYHVVISVTKNFDTRRQEEASQLGEMLSANPVLITWFGDIFFKNLDGPGHMDMAERAKVMLDPKIQQYLASKGQGEQVPPQVQAQLQQLQQQLQDAERAMATEKQKVEDKQAELAAKIKVAEIGSDKDITLQVMRDATAIKVAQIGALAKGAQVQLEADEERIALAQQASHDAINAHAEHQRGMEAAEQAHQHAVAQQDQAGQQALAQGDQQAGYAAAAADQSHEQTLEQQANAAALEPAAEEPGAEGA